LPPLPQYAEYAGCGSKYFQPCVVRCKSGYKGSCSGPGSSGSNCDEKSSTHTTTCGFDEIWPPVLLTCAAKSCGPTLAVEGGQTGMGCQKLEHGATCSSFRCRQGLNTQGRFFCNLGMYNETPVPSPLARAT
jgi:hypothetical protein